MPAGFIAMKLSFDAAPFGLRLRFESQLPFIIHADQGKLESNLIPEASAEERDRPEKDRRQQGRRGGSSPAHFTAR